MDLGTDAEGRRHLYRRSTHSVHVIAPDGDREHVARLGAADIEDWMTFIEDNWGWDPPRYGVDLGDMLAEALE